jgi:hypothetical protein
MTNNMEWPRRLRLVPDRALPPYAYVAGQHPHPIRDPRGHSFGIKPDNPEPPDPQRWQACSPYLYGIDLFNHGYYWEAHEVWEELWRACGRSGPAGTFLKALIGLAAAGFKVRVGNLQGVRRHAQRAARLFHETAMVIGPHGPSYMGLDLRALKRWASDVAECPPKNGNYGSRRETVVFDFVLWPV